MKSHTPSEKKQRRRAIPFPGRILAVGVIVLLQIALLLWLTLMLSSRVVWAYIILEIFSLLLVLTLIVKQGNPTLKLTWIIFILVLPVFGCLAYIFWSGKLNLPHLAKRMQRLEQQQRVMLPDDTHARGLLLGSYPQIYRQSCYIKAASGYPLYANTACDYFSPVDQGFPRILEELELANRYIFLEFFILAEGQMWNQMFSILRRKAAAGVEIRIMFDDFGSIARQYRRFAKRLRAEGIQVSVFNPLRPSVGIFMNNRNHRKMILIDGKTVITGGFNIGDEYVNLENRFGHWMDNILLLKGDAVRSYLVMYCTMWNFNNKAKKRQIFAKDYFISNDRMAQGFVQPYCDGPFTQSDPAKGVYMNLIYGASRYIYIATPYLILDHEFITALCAAARAGVDVRIVTPGHYDKWYVHPVTQSFYSCLMEAGIRIFEYTPGFLHSKVFVSDDTVGTVGTVNVDFRSFYYHFECGNWICGDPVILKLKEDLLSIMVRGKEIHPAKWARRPWYTKLKQSLLRLFAPLM